MFVGAISGERLIGVGDTGAAADAVQGDAAIAPGDPQVGGQIGGVAGHDYSVRWIR